MIITLVIVAIFFFVSLSIFLLTKSSLLTYAVISSLGFGILVTLWISPLFGYKYFLISEYWALIPITIWGIVGSVVSIFRNGI